MISYVTMQDVIEHGRDYLGSNASDSATRDCLRAALEAYRDIANAHNWSYLYTHGRIITFGMYDSTFANATLAYTHTGGQYERMITITGSTWPLWAAGSYIRCNAPPAAGQNGNIDPDTTSVVAYKVVERKSATVITLDPQVNPGANIASGTAFQIYRDTYLLPEDYIAQDQALYERNFGGMNYTHPREWLYENRYVFAQGTPQFYTITGDNLYPGRLVMKVYPWPYEEKTIDFVYKRRPRPLLVAQATGGTIATTNGSNVVTGTGTAFTPNMVGSVLRVSGNAKIPSSLIMNQNPAVFESFITDWVSATQVMLNDAVPAAYTGVNYSVSDMVDIEQGAMLNAYFRCVEKHLGMNRTLKDKPSARLQYAEALAEAKGADSRSFMGRQAGQGQALRRRLRDMPFTFNVE